MMKIVKISILFVLLGTVSCGDDKKESEDTKPAKENPKDDMSGFIDAEFTLQDENFIVKLPKGAYIDDEDIVTHIYLSPSDEERMVVAPGNNNTAGKIGDFEQKEDMFMYYGDGFVCVFGAKLENSEERIETMTEQFKLIAKSIAKVN